MNTKRRASELAGEYKPQKMSRMDEEMLWPRRGLAYQPTIKVEHEEPMWSQDIMAPPRHEGSASSTPQLRPNIDTVSHQIRRGRVSRARFILDKIAKNEAEGKVDPRDAEDKAKYLAEIAEYEAYKKANPEAFQTSLPKRVRPQYLSESAPKRANPEAFQTSQPKRNRSQNLSESAPKTAKTSQGKPRASAFVNRTQKFNEVARDSLAMVLVDEFHDDGRLLSEKWEEIEAKMSDMVTDMLVTSPTSPIPSFDSSDVVKGHRVIKCDDEFSRSFLADCVAKISTTWTGLKIRLVHARDIPRRPRARIWLPKGQSDHERVIKCLQAQNPDVHTEDWAILKAEKEMKSSQPFLLLINQRCLPQLIALDHKVRYGIRQAKIKVFLAEPDEILEEVDDTNKLLDDGHR